MIKMSKQNEMDFSGLFKLDVLIHLKVSTHSFYEVGLKKLIALASDKELIYILIDPQNEIVQKEYDWNFFEDPIKCMCFEPTGTWLLVVSEQKVILVPFLPLFKCQDTFDYKWPLGNHTYIPVQSICNATSTVWWLTKQSENIVIVGTKSGSLLFLSLDSNTIVAESRVSIQINDLQICFDDSLDVLSLIITGGNNQHWKLILEHRSLNYNWLQQCRTIQAEKDKKEGFMSYIKQLSKDKITLFSQSTSKDENKTQAVEYAIKPTEYLPSFRKGLNNWILSAQYENGNHFLTAFDMNEGTVVVESTVLNSPTKVLQPKIKPDGLYQQGLWSQRLVYLLRKNEVEVHSSAFSITKTDKLNMQASGESAAEGHSGDSEVWRCALPGTWCRAHLMSSRSPHGCARWREPTFMCDLQMPRFNLDPCLIVTTAGAAVLTTVVLCSSSACEWVVGGVTRGGVGAEQAAAALATPLPPLLRAAADMLLARGKLAPADFLYGLSQCPQDGWVARLGVFGRLEELSTYKQPENSQPCLSNTTLLIKLLSQLLKCSENIKETYELDRKLSTLSSVELEELCCFSTSLGLWDLVPEFSIYRGQPKLLLTAIENRGNICRGALNMLLRQKSLVPLLENESQYILDFISSNCSMFDTRLLKCLCIWLCPLQDQFRPVLRDLRQGITTVYTTRMLKLIDTFMRVVAALDLKRPSLDITKELPQHADTWKTQFVPKRSISCGLDHYALANDGYCTVANPSSTFHVKTELVGRVVSVACGRHHTLIITENGMYSSGNNTYGQLGVGCASDRGAGGEAGGAGGAPVPVARAWRSPLVGAAAGYYHSAAIDAGGRLYTWGWGVHGQLGLGTIEDEWTPQLVTKLQGRKVVSVGCGACHTAVLLRNGEVWCWGASAFGQLGSGYRHKTSVPVRVVLPGPITSLAVGYFHNLVLTTKGEVWTWGSSPQSVRAAFARRQHAATPSPTGPRASAPVPVPVLLPAQPEHEPHLAPARVDTANVTGTIVQLAAGWHHSFILTSSGALYGWGINFDGQLGSGDRKLIEIPTRIKIVTDMMIDNIELVESVTILKPLLQEKLKTLQIPNDEPNGVPTRAIVACGGDFTVFVDDEGKVFITGCQQNDPVTLADKVVTMKTTRRVIKIPTNRYNRFMFQYQNKIQNLAGSDSGSIERDAIDTRPNLLTSPSDLKRNSWSDEAIMLLKPWIKEESVSSNPNVAAKLAYHRGQYANCLKYSLENLNRARSSDHLYLKHTVATKSDSNEDLYTSTNKEKITVLVKSVLTKRIKEIGIAVLNEESRPPVDLDILKCLPCCCDEVDSVLNVFTSREVTPVTAVRASEIMEKCINMFPPTPELWQQCFAMCRDYYLENELPVDELELVLRKFMTTDAEAMASAVMFSEDCTQYGQVLSPKFYLNMCTEVLNTWG